MQQSSVGVLCEYAINLFNCSFNHILILSYLILSYINMSDISVVRIHIEYCSAWGYINKAIALQSALEKHFGASIVVAKSTGRSGSFEITASKSNDDSSKPVVLFSKLTTSNFPEHESFIQTVENYVKTGKVQETKFAPSGGCTIM